MANKILQRRGLKADLPTLSVGEIGFTTDTYETYVGTGSGNVNMGGSHWYRGTAMAGTSTTTGAYSYSACPEVKVDDIYMNTSNGNIYACTTAGKGTAAKWTYQGCIKGATGATGSYAAVDSVLSSTSTNPVQNKSVKSMFDYVCEGIASAIAETIKASSISSETAVISEALGERIYKLKNSGSTAVTVVQDIDFKYYLSGSIDAGKTALVRIYLNFDETDQRGTVLMQW